MHGRLDMEYSARASALVAPLNVTKQERDEDDRKSKENQALPMVPVAQVHMVTPPLTPVGRTGNSQLQQSQYETVFHNFLRAFYNFHPASTLSSSTEEESSITVPINVGDVVLVHSIHPNGWADGTLLASGARGWIPTNYCEAYDHEYVRNLLDALTRVWDILRASEFEDDLSLFTKQDYVRSMIAAVRCFLVRLPNIALSPSPLSATLIADFRLVHAGVHTLFEPRCRRRPGSCWDPPAPQRPPKRFIVIRQDYEAAARKCGTAAFRG